MIFKKCRITPAFLYFCPGKEERRMLKNRQRKKFVKLETNNEFIAIDKK